MDSNLQTDEGLPERIGRYRIRQRLGGGAMGAVFLAEQDEPRRQVAVKILASSAPSPEIAARFRREAELLATLEHPGIARLYEAGTEATGAGESPYFAMEYVRGANVLAHADGLKLGLNARLKLLASVCKAVHFAHTRGVIHRDLKPDNILVNEHGEPKVLDFGIAHLTERGDDTLLTAHGQVLGTIPYMSPEQLAGQANRVDPRSDVYALGVIGYQLIAGQLPYPGIESDSILHAIERIGRSAPQRLSRAAPGVPADVDTVIMKAIQADPAHRYQSAAEFAADIYRFLDHQPIEARQPTLSYTLAMFARRHKAATAAGAAVLVAMMLATVISIRFAVAEREARAVAEQRAAEREAVNDFLAEMLTAADPTNALGEKLTVANVLAVARAKLASDQSLAPSSRIQLQRTLANTFVGLGRSDDALELIEAAEAAAAEQFEAGSEVRLQLSLDHAVALHNAGREADALSLLDKLVAADWPDSRAGRVLAIEAGRARASVLISLGHFDRAEAALRPLRDRAAALLGDSHALTLDVAGLLALALQQQSRFDEALPVAEAVLASNLETLGPMHPQTSQAAEVVANIKRDIGQIEEAVSMYREIVDTRMKVFGPDHPLTLLGQSALAASLALAGRAEEGLEPARLSYQGLAALIGEAAENTRAAASLYAYVASEAGDLDTAARINSALIAQAEAKPEGPSINDLVEYNNLGNNYRELGRIEQSREVFARLVELSESLLPADHLHLALFRGNYAESLRIDGEFEQAARQLELAIPVLIETLGEDHPRVALFRERQQKALNRERGS